MTAPESVAWTEIKAEDAREGDRVRITQREDGYEGESIGTVDARRVVRPAFWPLGNPNITKVERATPSLPTDPGTVIDGKVRGRPVRGTSLGDDAWAVVFLDTITYHFPIRSDELTDRTLVAPAPGGEE